MNTNYTETTRQSWISRLTQSVKNVVGGLLMLLVASSLIFWNEGRAVKRAKALKEGKSQVVSITPQDWAGQADGSLLHMSGTISANSNLSDPDFGVNVKALRLKRQVDMYQWKEKVDTKKKKNLGGSEETVKEFTYEKAWSSSLIKSTGFKVSEGHQNPAALPYGSYTKNSPNANLETVNLNEKVINRLSSFEKYSVKTPPTKPGSRLITETGSTGNTTSSIYIGSGSDNAPIVGDTKVSFSIVPEGEYSIVGQKSTSGLGAFKSSNGNSILLVEKGKKPAEVMFEKAEAANGTTLWILRFVGFLIMFFGWQIIARPLVVVGDVVPIVGNILGLGLSVFSGVMAFTISLLVIALGWFAYRPILSLVLLAIGAGVFYYFKQKGRKELGLE